MTQATPVRDFKAYPEPSEVERLIAAAAHPRDKVFVALLLLPFTRVFFSHLSTARFTMMTATTLPLYNFNHIIAKNEVELLIERHRD